MKEHERYQARQEENLRRSVTNTINSTLESLAKEGKIVFIEQLNIIVNDATSVEFTIPELPRKGDQ